MTASEFVNRLKLCKMQIDMIILFGIPDFESFTPNINMAVCYLNDIPAVHPTQLKFNIEDNNDDKQKDEATLI